MNIYDELAAMSQRLDKVQLNLLDRRAILKNVRDNARMTDKWKKELTGAINLLGIDRDEVISELTRIQKMKDFILEK